MTRWSDHRYSQELLERLRAFSKPQRGYINVGGYRQLQSRLECHDLSGDQRVVDVSMLREAYRALRNSP